MKTLILSAFFLLNALLVIPYVETGQFKGVVIDNNNNLVKNAIIRVYNDKDIQIWYHEVGGNGIFSTLLEVGVYRIEITAKDHLPYKRDNVQIKSEKPFYLKAILTKDMTISKRENQIPITNDETTTINRKEKALFQSPNAVAKPFGYAMRSYESVGTYRSDDIYYVDYNTESYNSINENIFKDVVNNPLSTFSIDVDRASYANTRRFLSQNQMPPKDAVRIEELINYFDYDYPQPTNGNPFSVSIEASQCPWNKQNQLVLIGLQGENINEKDIPSSNLVFLIDVSGSMYPENRLPLLKNAFKFLVNNLRPQDKVAIVVYAGAAGLVLESTPGSEKHKINAALDRLQAGGSTAGGSGIKLAYKVAKENYIKNGNNRVILATDGDFNVGASSDGEMVRLIESKRDEGIFLSILGFGMGNYKDSKMESLSNAGNGNYFYIDNILEAKKVFGKELWGTLYTIAKDVKIQVEFNPAQVKAYRLIGYENRILNKEDFNNDKKDAGDIGCGHSVTALYEIVLADNKDFETQVDALEYQKQLLLNSKNMMTVKIRYKNPNEDISKLIVERYKLSGSNRTNNIVFAAAVAQFGMLLRDSEFKGHATYASTLKMANASLGGDEFGYRRDFTKLIEMAEILNGIRADL